MILRWALAAVLAVSCCACHAQSFAVVRVSMSPESEADDWGMGVRGRDFWATHVTLNELIAWAYSVSPRQIDRGPEWMSKEYFDVNGLPDSAGAKPSGEEYRTMLKSALAERFGMAINASQRVIPVYVLSVADGGLKLQAGTDANAKAAWGIHRGWLSISNMTFDAVAKVMQRTVFDRPVLDRTGVTGQYSFLLKWRADESQFSQMQSVPEEAGTDDVDDLYTAARKQLGLRIEARKEAAPVLVVNRVSHPSPN